MGAKMYDPNMVKYINQGKEPCFALKDGIKRQLRILDEQNAVNRYVWHNLPNELNGQLIERILYYRGQGMFFYEPTTAKFYFLPFALDGGIDIYGRYASVRPLPFNGSTEAIDKDKLSPLGKYLTSKSYTPIYDQVWTERITKDTLENHCVILRDYTEQISQTVLPRQQLQEPLLDMMSECIPYMNTALMNSTGVQGLRINSEADKKNVEIAASGVKDAALLGKKYVPVTAEFQLEDLSGGTVAKSEEFLLAMQALDNYRLSLYGLDNGGLFQKRSHMLEAEQKMNQGQASLIYQDGLMCRNDFADRVNSITGWGIYCTPAESVINADLNGDGIAVDQNLDYTGEQQEVM